MTSLAISSTSTQASWTDPPRDVAADPVTYDLLLASLIGFSLITADSQRISVHRLVQLTIRNQLTPAERTAFRACAVRLFVAAFPDNSRTGQPGRPAAGSFRTYRA